MNERIKELVSQEMEEYLDGAYADHGSAKSQLTLFAELIIKECIDVVDKYSSRVMMYEQLKEHFGLNDD